MNLWTFEPWTLESANHQIKFPGIIYYSMTIASIEYHIILPNFQVKDLTSWMQSNCCALIDGRRVEDICGESLPTTDCKCMDYLYCRLAVVTAISSKHFKQAQDMICSVQKNAPNTDIFVYDLGLKETHERFSQSCIMLKFALSLSRSIHHILKSST